VICIAIKCLEEINVQVGEVARLVVRDKEKGTDCSMCVSIYPVKAYPLDPSNRTVMLEQ
jgi:hypothetical protein